MRDAEVGAQSGILEQLAHLSRLTRDRTDARDRREQLRRAQQREGVAGGGRVEHHQVVVAACARLRGGLLAGGRRAPLAGAAVLGELPHLDHADHLARAGRGRDQVLETRARGEYARGHAPAERPQPLREDAVAVDRQAPQILAELDLHAMRRRLGVAEQRGQPTGGAGVGLGAAELDDDRAPSAARGEQAERGGERRLADAALAGDHDQPAVEHRLASPNDDAGRAPPAPAGPERHLQFRG